MSMYVCCEAAKLEPAVRVIVNVFVNRVARRVEYRGCGDHRPAIAEAVRRAVAGTTDEGYRNRKRRPVPGQLQMTAGDMKIRHRPKGHESS